MCCDLSCSLTGAVAAQGVTHNVATHVAAVASAVGAEAGEFFRGTASGHPVREALVKVGGASIGAASEVPLPAV